MVRNINQAKALFGDAKVDFVEGDVLNPASLDAAIVKAQPRGVIYTIGYPTNSLWDFFFNSSLPTMEQVEHKGAADFIDAVKRYNPSLPIVFISSTSVTKPYSLMRLFGGVHKLAGITILPEAARFLSRGIQCLT